MSSHNNGERSIAINRPMVAALPLEEIKTGIPPTFQKQGELKIIGDNQDGAGKVDHLMGIGWAIRWQRQARRRARFTLSLQN